MKYWLASVSAFAVLTACGAGTDPTTEAPTEVAEADSAVVEAASRPPANPLRNAYFGDMHIHTRNSFDAYIFNVRTTPEDAYRFALGETVQHPSGYDITVAGEPLDFLAVTDHGAYLGILPAMDTPGHPLSEVDIAKRMFSTDPEAITNAFQSVGATVRSGVPIPEIDDRELVYSVWQDTIAAADKYYRPGEFTTFAAYEYTSVTNEDRGEATFAGGNLHRNVFFENEAPDRLFSVHNSPNPEDLWDWLDQQRELGMDAISIPHNSNVSDGKMFDLVTYDQDPLDRAYSSQRIRNEPLVEITQVKGTSETHPALSPNDEWANFEIYDKLLASDVVSRNNGSYVREALARGFAIEKATGINPYKFGFLGATDSHVAGGAFDEKAYWSKVGIIDGSPEQRGSIPPDGGRSWEGVALDPSAEDWFSRWSASGYAVVWAEENTRESIFAAMRRKETYATSGTRIRVRFFAGNGLDEGIVNAPDFIEQGYAEGVPMGGDVIAGDASPVFAAWAVRDPRGAPLQRLQIVKSWLSADGETQDLVYDIACSDGSSPDPATHRCADNGSGVNLEDCSLTGSGGASDLRASWRDPNFDPTLPASYYIRVLENPSCRWSTWDAIRNGTPPNPDLPTTLQERAWTSPIWVSAVQ